jgi:adenylate kinase family enzyme
LRLNATERGVRRILIIGPGGAGKSTLARVLGARLSLPVIHLDREFWRPGWVQPPTSEWHAHVDTLLQGDAWVMDGNFGGTLAARVAACDTVLLLDQSPLRCVLRVMRRRLIYRGRARPDMSTGCTEQLSVEFLSWIWTYRRKKLPAVLSQLAIAPNQPRVIHLRTPRAVQRWLDGLPRALAAQAGGASGSV